MKHVACGSQELCSTVERRNAHGSYVHLSPANFWRQNMNVRELIAQLQKMPSEADVYFITDTAKHEIAWIYPVHNEYGSDYVVME